MPLDFKTIVGKGADLGNSSNEAKSLLHCYKRVNKLILRHLQL